MVRPQCTIALAAMLTICLIIRKLDLQKFWKMFTIPVIISLTCGPSLGKITSSCFKRPNVRCTSMFTYIIDNKSIDRVYSSNFLGVLIVCKFNWKKHISLIKVKVSKTIAVMYRARYVLDKKCLVLYCALVLPYMSYCSGAVCMKAG